VCETPFIARKSDTKCCSNPCSRKRSEELHPGAEGEASMRWWRANPEKRAASSHRYYLKRKAKAKEGQ
jgi:hypothetical protein